MTLTLERINELALRFDERIVVRDYQDTAKALRTLAKIQEAHEQWSNTSDEYANREFAWKVSDILSAL